MSVAVIVIVLSVVRIGIGLAPILFANLTRRIMKLPPEHDTGTTRLMARLFGVRDVGLGVLGISAAYYPDWLGLVCLFNAAIDGADAMAIAHPLLEGDKLVSSAYRGLAFALSGLFLWTGAWLMV